MNTVEIRDLSFSYRKKPVFQGLNLTLPAGLNVILGPNGSGKTTLFKLLCQLLPPARGELYLDDRPYSKTDIRQSIAYLPQQFNVYPNFKVYDFLAFVGQVKYGFRGNALKQEVLRVAELADLNAFLYEKQSRLSDGMRKRVGIAQALLGTPKLIVADEPTAGLDPEQRLNFNLLLNRIPKDVVVLISTHIIEDIQDFYDHIVILSEQKAHFQGSYSTLLHALDGRVYEAILPPEDYAAVEQNYTVLEKTMASGGNGDVLVHFFADAEPVGVDCRPTAPSLAEIWSYYKTHAETDA